MNTEQRLEDLKRQIAHLRAKHYSSPEGRDWIFELESKVKILTKFGKINRSQANPCGWGRYPESY